MNNTTIETPREKATWKTTLRWIGFIPLSLIVGFFFGAVLPRSIGWFASLFGYGDSFGVLRILRGLAYGHTAEAVEGVSLPSLGSEIIFGIIMVLVTLKTAGYTCPRSDIGVWVVCALMMLFGALLMYFILPLWGVVAMTSYLALLVLSLSFAVFSPVCSYYLTREKM